MFALIPLLGLTAAAVAVAAAASSSSSGSTSSGSTPTAPDDTSGLVTLKRVHLSLEQRFQAQAARGAAERAQREADSRAEIERQRKFWSEVPGLGPFFAAAYEFLAPAMEYMIDFGNALSNWNAPDWNSDAEKARVNRALQRFADVRLGAPNPMPDDEYKTYADLLERELSKLDALWAARPEIPAFWSALVGWVESNPTYAPVLDMMQLRVAMTAKGTKLVPVWPPSSDMRSSDPEWVSPQALAIATLAAAMRGTDAAAARDVMRRAHRDMMTRDPALRQWDNSGWYLGGVLEAADKATRGEA